MQSVLLRGRDLKSQKEAALIITNSSTRSDVNASVVEPFGHIPECGGGDVQRFGRTEDLSHVH